MVHAGLSLRIPEMELDDDDAENLSKATLTLMDQFEVKPDPKIAAVVGFVIVAGRVYVPKAIMFRNRLIREEQAKARDRESGFQ